GLPQGTQTACSQQGKLPTVFTVNLVETPAGKGITCPSAGTHGSWRHEPAVLPQSASLLHAPKRFIAAFVVQRLSPLAPLMTYVLPAAIGVPTTIGSHGVGFVPHGEVVVVTVPRVVLVVGVVVVVLVVQDCPEGWALQTRFRTSLSTFFGLPLEVAVAMILHLPSLVPCFLSFTTTEDAWQLSVSPDGEKLSDDAPWHLPFTLTRLSAVPVQEPWAWFAQSFRLYVHWPLSASQLNVPPFLAASGT